MTLSLTIGQHGDVPVWELRRLVDVVAAANQAAGVGEDEELQNLETTLDLLLLAAENAGGNEV